MSESKASKFAKGIANAKDKALEGLKTSIVGLLSGTGRLTDSFFTGLNALAELPQGTSTKLHNAAKSIIESVKKTKLSGNAGIIRTGVHAGKAIFGGITTLLIEAINIIDKALLDNAAIDAMAKKFQELNGDTSKLKKWFKEKYRINSYIVYYATILVVAFGLNVGYKSDMLHQIRETVNNKMEKMLEDDDENETPAVDSSNSKDDKNGKDDIIIVVQKGDKLEKIAERYGVSKEYLIKHNRIEDPDKIDAGQELRIEKSYIENKNKVAENGKEEVKPTNTDKKTTVQKDNGPDPKPGKQVEPTEQKTKVEVVPNTIKGIENLVSAEAFALINDADLFVSVGDYKGVNYEYLRELIKKHKNLEGDILMLAFFKIQTNPEYAKIYRPSLMKSEGFEPFSYVLGDGHVTQGGAMTWDYPVLPDQELEKWMQINEVRMKTGDQFTPLYSFIASIRSFNDYWQQIDIFGLDPSQNQYKLLKYIVKETKISFIHFDGVVALNISAFQSLKKAKKVVNGLTDPKDKTKLDLSRLKHVYSPKGRVKSQANRAKKDKETFEGKEITLSLIVGQHSPKRITYKNPQDFLNKNWPDGADFNIKFDRYINRAQKTATFKLIYHTINPKDRHFDMTADELTLVSKLNENTEFKQNWVNNMNGLLDVLESEITQLDNDIKSLEVKIKHPKSKANLKANQDLKNKKMNLKGAKMLLQRNIRVQADVVFKLLAKPEYYYKNPSEVQKLLKDWSSDKKYMSGHINLSKSMAQLMSQQEQDQILLAQANNMRGLGM